MNTPAAVSSSCNSRFVLQVAMGPEAPDPFPTVDVPDHAHYTIGSVILAIGITGMLGNFLVIYAFSRYRDVREQCYHGYCKKVI